jgi:hypothetical protein
MIATPAMACPVDHPHPGFQGTQTVLLDSSLKANDVPWLYSALSQVWQLQQSGEQVPGIGDLRVSSETATRVRLLLAMIDIIALPAPQLSPVSGGGVSVEWQIGPKEVKYSFYPDGGAMFFEIVDDEISDDGTLRTMSSEEITRPLKWMLDVQS